VQGLIDFLSQHPALALGVVFAAALLESVAVIGTVIPGSSVVFAAGILIGLQALDLWGVAEVAVIGAVLGDGFSYWLGHRYQSGYQPRLHLDRRRQISAASRREECLVAWKEVVDRVWQRMAHGRDRRLRLST